MTSDRTSNFGLPLYTANDITSWLVDFNGAMNEIDTAMQGVKTIADQASTDATGASGSVAEINQTLINIQNSISNINSQLNSRWKSSAFTYSSKITDQGTGCWHNPLTRSALFKLRFTINSSLSNNENIITTNLSFIATSVYAIGVLSDGSVENISLNAINNALTAPNSGLAANRTIFFSGLIPTN